VISSFGLVFNTGDLFPASRGSALIGGLSIQALVGVAIERGEGGASDRISHGAGIRDVTQLLDDSITSLPTGGNGRVLRLRPRG
jgi:glucose/arabinose dehydrogenase